MPVRRPNAHREALQAADFLQLFGQRSVLLVGNVDPQQHGEQAMFVMVIHLDFGDIGPLPRHMVNDGVGQPPIVGAHGGDHNLHDGTRLELFGRLAAAPCPMPLDYMSRRLIRTRPRSWLCQAND